MNKILKKYILAFTIVNVYKFEIIVTFSLLPDLSHYECDVDCKYTGSK